MSRLTRLYLAHKITEKKSLADPDKLNNIIRAANIDLNPHQVDSAVFAFKSPLSRGAILADEVGLGKTIEAGLIINQLWAEGRKHILILVPASLRTQWQDEMRDRFYLESKVLDGPILKKLQKEQQRSNPLQDEGIFIASHNFAYRYDFICREIVWDLVVIDEAHRLRNVWRKSNKTAKKVREVIKGRPKVLLTATPLQNNLMELFGLTSFLEENYLGTEYSFKTFFVKPVNKEKKFDRLKELKNRLMGTFDEKSGDHQGGVLSRTLRKQVKGLVPFTYRFCYTQDFAPNDDEMELYNSVSDYLQRPYLASTKARQRNMMELVYRKILASSSFAIAGTLKRVANYLGKRLQDEYGLNINEVNKVVEEARTDLELEWNRNLPGLKLDKFIKKKKEAQEILPGLDDLEVDEEKIQEELEEADDLGEDEQFDDDLKEVEEKGVDYNFTKDEVIAELKDVLGYYYLAISIKKNQKSHALVKALKKIYKLAEKKKWPKKAVIFTESRRTQDHLEKLLSGLGYNIILFNGSNAGKRAREVFEEWQAVFPDEAEKGNRAISLRKALIWKFKTLEDAILITTEAGAEGLNLQFANIVINYDLPWNPQRIEQRIGRCHRYGQKLDVLVANFLNKRNYADERVYEILKEKIKLFGNLFDFTDKVLGTEVITDDGYDVREVALAGLGTGIDFERKVLQIYRKCRTEKEIEKSFKQLQMDLQDVIEEKIEDAQKKVIQHFDAEVRQKLKLRKLRLDNSLSRYDNMLRQYAISVLGSDLKFENEKSFYYQGKKYVFGDVTSEQREKKIIPMHAGVDFIASNIDFDKKISGKWQVILKHPKIQARKVLEELIDKEGQLTIDLLTAKRRTINNDEEIFERLIVSSVYKSGNTWKRLPQARAEKLLELEVEKEEVLNDRLRDELIDFAQENIESQKIEISQENENFVVEEVDLLNRFTEEALLKFKQEIEQREKEIKDLNKKMRASRTAGYHEIQEVQQEVEKKQKELFRAQKKYFKAQEEQFKQKDYKIGDLRNKLQMNYDVKRLAEVKFIIKS